MKDADEPEILTIDGYEIAVTHPEKLHFSTQPEAGKLNPSSLEPKSSQP